MQSKGTFSQDLSEDGSTDKGSEARCGGRDVRTKSIVAGAEGQHGRWLPRCKPSVITDVGIVKIPLGSK